MERLLDEGFVLLYPHYRGTWSSDGTMSWEGCVETIVEAVRFLQGGEGRGLYDLRDYTWEVDDHLRSDRIVATRASLACSSSISSSALGR